MVVSGDVTTFGSKRREGLSSTEYLIYIHQRQKWSPHANAHPALARTIRIRRLTLLSASAPKDRPRQRVLPMLNRKIYCTDAFAEICKYIEKIWDVSEKMSAPFKTTREVMEALWRIGFVVCRYSYQWKDKELKDKLGRKPVLENAMMAILRQMTTKEIEKTSLYTNGLETINERIYELLGMSDEDEDGDGVFGRLWGVYRDLSRISSYLWDTDQEDEEEEEHTDDSEDEDADGSDYGIPRFRFIELERRYY